MDGQTKYKFNQNFIENNNKWLVSGICLKSKDKREDIS